MDELALSRNQEFKRIAELAVRQYSHEIHEITYIEYSADNLIVLANHQFVFRFPRSEDAAHRLYYETALLQKLAGKVTAVAIPKVIHISHQPLYVVAEYIEGLHLTAEQVKALSEAEQTAIGVSIARFIIELNAAAGGSEVQRLRTEARVVGLKEPWAAYFERLFGAGQKLPNEKLHTVVNELYPLWLEYTKAEQATQAIHDDLHLENLLFLGPKLSGILDFGYTDVGSVEEELRWLYALGETVLGAAITEYQRQTGQSINREHVRVWLIMHELATYTKRLAAQDTESRHFIRAQDNLRAWLPNFPL